jgi:two-component system response regulator
MRELEIILIDDSVEDRDLTVRSLNRCKLANKITTISNANDALEYIVGTQGDMSLRLILLDLNMPGMSGLEFLKIIRSNKHTRGIPVAILTSTTQLPDIKESLELGVHYIAKPIEFDDLAKMAASLGFSILLIKED